MAPLIQTHLVVPFVPFRDSIAEVIPSPKIESKKEITEKKIENLFARGVLTKEEYESGKTMLKILNLIES